MAYDAPGVITDDEAIRDFLIRYKTWAVVGLSSNMARPAWGVAGFLQGHDKRIIPVHPKAETVHGERGHALLEEVPDPVDVVDVFVNAELAPEVTTQAVAIGAKAIWYQLGVVNDDAVAMAVDAGLRVVVDRCPAIEWPRLIGA
ncbi:CoA-binding protein [Yinghuangia sp. ASG 101]|uniref:CoA-binding protein n=1 Tax=Yinghuangia sp. ASG 101 TaxID=2896848 RepID=UPI001E43F078|nr:CoA-binding protein [Yinghuangia sp. ASG 101]UGQ09507.1 CoA-binding protein [Yinghuangia sp. ASG 101]